MAEVLRAEGGRYYVHYSGYDASYDEWVAPEWVRRLAVKKIRYRPADRYTYEVGDAAIGRVDCPVGQGLDLFC